MGVVVVALGAHRHEVGDLVLAPRGIVDAGTLAGLIGAGLEPSTVDGDDRQPRGDRHFVRAFPVLEILDPLIPIVPQLLPHFVGDPSHLPLADVDLGLVGERLRGGGEGSAADGGADDLTKDRWRDIVRVEPQTRAEREKNPGDTSGNDRPVRRSGWSRHEPEWFAGPWSEDTPAYTRDRAGDRRGAGADCGGPPRWCPG